MRIFLIASACVALAAPASAATRNFGITGFDRIRVEGPFQVTLKNGVAPFARAEGSPAAIDRVAIDVQGSTLVIRTNPSWGGYPGKDFGPVSISVGTHELSSAWLRGAGSLQIDKVKAQKFVLSVEGAGGATLERADVDQLRIAVSGSGSATIGGRAAKLSAAARGVGVIDASALTAKDADIGAEGPATVKATVAGDAKVAASGVSSVILSGRPACTTTLTGSASVTGCR